MGEADRQPELGLHFGSLLSETEPDPTLIPGCLPLAGTEVESTGQPALVSNLEARAASGPVRA